MSTQPTQRGLQLLRWTVSALVIALIAPASVVAQSSGCRPADTMTVPKRLAYFRSLLTTTNPARIAVRDSLGLSAASASKINLVTKASTCVSAVNALNAQRQETGKVRQVWVYTLGNNYAVEDPADQDPDQYTLIYLFSNTHVYKRTLAQ
jgi:hypothetical protein